MTQDRTMSEWTSHSDLSTDMREMSVDLASPSATKSAIEFNVYYDNKPNEDFRIRGAITDGDW